jgi:hypothetical protein
MAKEPVRPEIQVRRQGDTLVPCSEHDAELLRRHPHDAVLAIRVHEPRSVPYQRLYWSVLKSACKAKGLWANPEALHDKLKDAVGYKDRSTGFSEMSAEEWREYAQFALERLRERFFPHLTVEDIAELGRGRLSAEERRALDQGAS